MKAAPARHDPGFQSLAGEVIKQAVVDYYALVRVGAIRGMVVQPNNTKRKWGGRGVALTDQMNGADAQDLVDWMLNDLNEYLKAACQDIDHDLFIEMIIDQEVVYGV